MSFMSDYKAGKRKEKSGLGFRSKEELDISFDVGIRKLFTNPLVLVTVFTTLVCLFGFTYSVQYYQQFNIDITKYLDIEDIMFNWLESKSYSSVVLFVLVFFIPSTAYIFNALYSLNFMKMEKKYKNQITVALGIILSSIVVLVPQFAGKYFAKTEKINIINKSIYYNVSFKDVSAKNYCPCLMIGSTSKYSIFWNDKTNDVWIILTNNIVSIHRLPNSEKIDANSEREKYVYPRNNWDDRSVVR